MLRRVVHTYLLVSNNLYCVVLEGLLTVIHRRQLSRTKIPRSQWWRAGGPPPARIHPRRHAYSFQVARLCIQRTYADYLRQAGCNAVVCPCAVPRKRSCMDLHELFNKGKSWFSLTVVDIGRDPDWPSLSFRGHSRSARSFRHKIDCSAETVRDTAKVTIEL